MKPARILFVDDEPHIRSLVALKMKGAGYDVQVAGNVQLALEAIKAELPDLVVSDYRLPGGLTGVDLILELRRINREMEIPAENCTPVILLTGSVAITQKLKSACKEIRNFMIISKPFSPRNLLAEVQKMLSAQNQG